PTFGGTSWLAFGTLESGVWVPDQLRYHFLLNSRVRPMADFFREAGYRTVSVMPGTTLPWPEGAFFSYEKSYYAKDLGYRGPSFGWSPMADQFVLDRIRWWEIQPGRRPLFARYVLISTHAPFHIQPPYVPNWEAIGDGAAYHRMEPVTYPINWPDLTRAGGAYVRSMGYEFDVLKDYLVRFVGKNALVIIMGDHQPNAQITGEDAPWLVPVHAVSANPSLLAPFVDQGYVPGMGPGDTLACRGMDEFLPGFLDAFSR
ncbi:MAG: sulfatase-like hydrolase/transferase, partial [Desulfobacterales bacterium]